VAVLTLAPVRDGDRYRLDVPAGWRQGRGMFGGLVVATLVRAIEDRIADPTRVIRSVTAALPAPVEATAAEIDVDVLRAGSAVTTARAMLRQAGQPRAHVVAIAGAARRSDLAWQDLAPPSAPPWQTLAPVPWTPVFPEFARHFEYRLVEGAPASGGAACTIGWVHGREPGERRDAGYVSAMIDAWWPAVLPRTRALLPMATIAFTLELIGAPGDGPLLYRGTAPVCGGGYFLETRELWTAAGELVALNHQTFAII
jgi:acyl-CoA thioesterase